MHTIKALHARRCINEQIKYQRPQHDSYNNNRAQYCFTANGFAD